MLARVDGTLSLTVFFRPHSDIGIGRYSNLEGRSNWPSLRGVVYRGVSFFFVGIYRVKV
ncbi:uncharacterized protein EI90DRAFT_3029154 [Cantharellus anzutake]|uniref:uncharacterized protein n=1 Tax=Cantharellus anzutake TaxID=1750568 RepID=UPI00190389FA|nr:uncharacterized protein EI90DRAFT_3029154 [Cantharellus anzutake]KAF8344302.1 hypothetical protein EI90DRAFT_3029154 [Cantharellus anzutake]